MQTLKQTEEYIEEVQTEETVNVEVAEEEKPEVKRNFQLEELVIKEEPVEEVVQQIPAETPYKRSTVIETRPKQVNRIEQDNNPYAIEKIEMIMHDSRSEISREERKIILNNWRRLADRVGTGLLPVARYSTSVSNTSASLIKRKVSGLVKSLSHLEIACLVTPRASPKAS